MPWSDIVGHEAPVGRLRASLRAGRLHPCLLFEGPDGIGKRLVALTLAQTLHCPEAERAGGDPCGRCRSCIAIASSGAPETTQENQSDHPGIRVLTPSRPDEREASFGATGVRGEVRAQIAVSQVRAAIAEGMTRGLAPGPRVVIVDPADKLGESAANALLKTLEEPPASERFILITSKPSALLPTILSRCVRFRFGLLGAEEVRRVLAARLLSGSNPAGKSPSSAPSHPSRGAVACDLDLITALAGGRIGRALDLAGGTALQTLRETRSLLLESLEALVRGLPCGTFAVVAGAAFKARERDEWIEAIGVLELLLRDLAVLSVDPAAPTANADLKGRLLPLAAPLGTRASRALGVVNTVRSDLRVNVNGRLAAERILIELAR